MLLGQLVAISVSTGLFLFAVLSHPRIDSRRSRIPVTLWLPVILAIVPIELTPCVVGTSYFLPNLLALHALLLVPFFSSTGHLVVESRIKGNGVASSTKLYAALTAIALASQTATTYSLSKTYYTIPRLLTHLINQLFSHPAISSIGFDAIWVVVTLFTWFLSTGTGLTKLLKMIGLGLGGMGVAAVSGVDSKLLLSVVPIAVMAGLAGIGLLLHTFRDRNNRRRAAVLRELGVEQDDAVATHGKKAPQKTLVAGFWHPYWSVCATVPLKRLTLYAVTPAGVVSECYGLQLLSYSALSQRLSH